MFYLMSRCVDIKWRDDVDESTRLLFPQCWQSTTARATRHSARDVFDVPIQQLVLNGLETLLETTFLFGPDVQGGA